MAKITHLFDTKEEVAAFLVGIEYVNDSNIHIPDYLPIPQKRGYSVIIEDHDAEEEQTRDHRDSSKNRKETHLDEKHC